jgi:glycogen debranching enzyme
MMPAEGRLGHDYFLFSREPTFWFGRLGEHIHEGLAMILLARLDPRAAMDALRVFMDRVEADGYLPYNIGPVVEQTALRTASAPLFSYVASEVAAETRDRDFLRQAYETGAKLHRFWREQRDVDGDGLCEWGGYGKTESVRDLENVIWENVADPHLLEGLDCNSFLVMEEKSLARMAAALGLAAEAAEWTARAEARAALVNALMWDEETGFYYHVTRDGHSMSHRAPGDLKRMEVQGFLPLWAGIVPPARLSRILSRLTDPSLFWRDFGVTGLAVNDPYYSPEPSRCCRWNGPVWVPWQFLLMRGLLGVGEVERARELTAKTLAAVAAQLKVVHQFRELYHPDDARVANRSMPNYIWSAMAALMLLETTENR